MYSCRSCLDLALTNIVFDDALILTSADVQIVVTTVKGDWKLQVFIYGISYHRQHIRELVSFEFSRPNFADPKFMKSQRCFSCLCRLCSASVPSRMSKKTCIIIYLWDEINWDFFFEKETVQMCYYVLLNQTTSNLTPAKRSWSNNLAFSFEAKRCCRLN